MYPRVTPTPNANQLAAITHPPAPLMIIAGAGTGKTFTLIQRIVHLIQHYHIDPETILVITYTEKAAQELHMRVMEAVGSQAQALNVSTFHAFCYRVVCEHPSINSQPPTLMDEGDAIFLLLNHFDDLLPFQSRLIPQDPVKAVTKCFLPFFNRLRDELIDPQSQDIDQVAQEFQDPELEAQFRDLMRIYPFFQRWKQEENRVDYGDMILRCHQLLTQDRPFLEQQRHQYQHIIVDEFQDNNFALNAIVGLLVGQHGSVTVVGDVDQVVYSFRGASVANIKDFETRYHSFANYREIDLVTNYRSTQPILDVANHVIQHNTNHIKKWLTAAENVQSGSLPEIWWGERPQQLQWITHKIKSLLKAGVATFADIAILCRTREQVTIVARHLREARLPVQVYLTGFFQIPVIRDLLAWCHVIAGGPHQEGALYRLLNKNLESSLAHKITAQLQRGDMFPQLIAISSHSKEYAPLEKLLNLIQLLRDHTAKLTAGEMVVEICEYTGLLKPYLKRYEFQDRVALLNAGEFINRAQTFSLRYQDQNRLQDFVEYIDILQPSGTIPTLYPSNGQDRAAILVQTIHGVKGGEFPIVIIPFNRSGSFPLNYRPSPYLDTPLSAWRPQVGEDCLSDKEFYREEERRLFYVAVTRAQKQLFLLTPKKATSPFIKEIPVNCIEEFEMPTQDTETQSTNSPSVRSHFEQRLLQALGENQFEKVREYTRILERLTTLERGQTVQWGNEPWEQELQKRLPEKLERTTPYPLRLSTSAAETYLECPLKYQLAHIDRIPEAISKPQLVFGTIIHRVLEEFHNPDQPQTEKQLLELLEIYWKPEAFDYRAREIEFKRQGEELLRRYFAHFQEAPPRVKARELRFTFEVDQVTITGKIDRIDESDHGYRIVDYKTGKTRTSAKKNLQLAIYCLYLYLNPETPFGGLPEAATLYYLRLEDKPQDTHQFLPEDLEGTREKIKKIRDGIWNQEFNPRKGFHCDWCDYKKLLCPAWEED
ncbi:MAG: ATP-dependent helicase [Fidelibacterota bacterium]